MKYYDFKKLLPDTTFTIILSGRESGKSIIQRKMLEDSIKKECSKRRIKKMGKKVMNLNFAVDMLYQEATQEDSKYSQNQKEGAYNALKENIIIIELLTKIIKKEKEYCKNNNISISCDSHWLNEGEKEVFESWFDQI